MNLRKHFVIRFLMAALFVVFTFGGAFSAAAYNGEHVNLDRSKKSSVLIVGDCMILGMSEEIKDASFNATQGAHHIYYKALFTGKYADRNMVIGSPKYTQEMKKIVKNCLKRQGECQVVIVSTDNDTGFTNWQKTSLDGIKKLKKNLRKVKYKGKRAEVFVTSMLPPRGRDSLVSSYNRKVKKSQGKYYINIGLTDDWVGYYSGPDHLTGKGEERLYKKIMKAVNKQTKKAKKDKKAK